jgi:hypothetical protein
LAASISPSRVNIIVTFSAGDKGFASAGSHDLHPPGPLPLSFVLKVFQCSDVVDFHMLPRSTQFAGVGQEPFFEFRSISPHWGYLVIEDGFGFAC